MLPCVCQIAAAGLDEPGSHCRDLFEPFVIKRMTTSSSVSDPEATQMSLNYVMLGSNDVAKARSFFDAVLPTIGGRLVAEHMPHAFCYELRGGGRMWVASPFDGEVATPGNGNMVGLKCESKREVQAAHETSLSKGGINEGDPGPRPQYGPEFYGAYIRDLDGNKISFVYFDDVCDT